MASAEVLDRLDTLIDDLLHESDLPASLLASMLTAARDSVKDGYHVALARRVSDASNAIKDRKDRSVTHVGHSASWRGTPRFT
jgi:hypothetical protein